VSFISVCETELQAEFAVRSASICGMLVNGLRLEIDFVQYESLAGGGKYLASVVKLEES
jgi:hypothetical protein